MTTAKRGAVTLRYALQVSINTVAAQMIDMLTPQVAYDQLVISWASPHLVERTDDGNTDISYAGMALGQLTNGVTVKEMCQAYTMLCNKGIYTEEEHIQE
jgi:penicillin-binding protein 1A